MDAATLLRRLERLRARYGGDAAGLKLAALAGLERRRLATAGQVLRLHECLCFLRAYPDDRRVLERVARMLDRFDRRGDLRAHRERLADSGIAGTSVYFSFFWYTARWLARRWPGRIAIDWEVFDRQDRLEPLLPLLVPYAETPALDMVALGPREWLDKLRHAGETDAGFLIRRFEALAGDEFVRETLYESLDVPIHLAPGPATPNRSRARLPGARVVFQQRPLARGRPSLAEELERPPAAVRDLSPRQARRLLDVIREAMVTRTRDLYVFLHADERDVRLVDCGGGLQFACVGAIPLRRLVLETLYGFLTIHNGVPIGYVLSSSLFGSTEVAYNVFESFRDAEAARVFGRALATMRHLFGSRAFSIDPYQLGHNNPEGLESGAWWFYYKLGFRPTAPAVKRVLRAELKKMRADPGHRSGVDVLARLAAEPLFLDLRPRRGPILGEIDLGRIGLRSSRLLARRFGADREGGIASCAREAARLLGVRSQRGLSAGERLAWERWSPLILSLPGVARWSAADKRLLARIARAKGGRRESDFLPLFERHPRLQRALLRMAR